ncbi:hypothetical protein AB7M33_004103 [Pseudomonas sp. Y3 TE3536]
MQFLTVTACQSCVVDVQRQAETRAVPEGPQRKKGGRSMFRKCPTRKGLNLILSHRSSTNQVVPRLNKLKEARLGLRVRSKTNAPIVCT